MKILIALGGNAILKPGDEGTEAEQLSNLSETSDSLAELLARGHRISVTHGNGPQVGDIFLAYELAKSTISPMSLDICGAQSQGMIGYLLQQSLDNALMKKGLQVPTVALLTRTIIDKGDPAMKNPTKPIGPFYSKEDAAQHEATWHMKQDSVRGYRRLVPSPLPKLVVERDIIKKLFDAGYIAIHSGGGGIPVVRLDDGTLSGIEAVIDKDLTASLMASYLQVDLLLILTDVEQVYLNYGTKNQIALDKLTVKDCERYQREGQFATGSMAPKIEAARRFVLESPKSRAIISSIKRALEALDGKAGTEIVN